MTSHTITPRLAARYVAGEARIYARSWRSSVIATFLTPLLYLGAFAFGVGALVEEQGTVLAQDVTYAEFVAPGLLASTSFLLVVGLSLWRTYSAIAWSGTWKATLSTPVGVPDLVAGRIAWLGIRGAVAGVAYALATVVLGLVDPVRAVLMVGPATLLAMSLAAVLLAMTYRTENMEDLSLLYRFGAVPLFLLSGAFFPIEQLPDPVEALARALPVWHGVELTRAVGLGTTPGAPWMLSLAYLVVLVPVGWWLGTRALTRRMTP